LRRTLEVISLALFLLGLELATGTPSLTIARLQETIAYPLGSDGAESVEWRVLGGLVVMVVALILAALTVMVRHRTKGIQSHAGCPKCGADTKRVRRNAWQRMLGGVVGKALSARHCGDCGWKGASYKH
jgi:hypothetical protein